MKLHLLKIIFAVFLFAACSSDGDGNDEHLHANPCETPATFTVVQNDGTLIVNASGSANSTFELSLSQNEGNPDLGHIETFTGTTKNFSLSSLYLDAGNTYYFYIRSVCSPDSKSDWSAVKSISIANYCGLPFDLNVEYDLYGPRFTWSAGNSNSLFEVEYGTSGFALGTGMRTNVDTNPYYYEMPIHANTEYDFYVRAYCNGSLGWTEWVGPYTFLSTGNSNLCLQPSNVNFTMEGPNAVNLHWNYNGEDLFEYALISGSQTIETASLEVIGTGGTPVYTGLSPFIQYHFYVRAVCADGNRTPWATILVDF